MSGRLYGISGYLPQQLPFPISDKVDRILGGSFASDQFFTPCELVQSVWKCVREHKIEEHEAIWNLLTSTDARVRLLLTDNSSVGDC